MEMAGQKKNVPVLKMCPHFSTNYKWFRRQIQQSGSLYRHEVTMFKSEEVFKHLEFNRACLKHQRIKAVWVKWMKILFVCMYVCMQIIASVDV